MPPAQAGDRVLLNTTAVTLNLGTGGYHFVHAIISDETENDQAGEPSLGHLMKLKYTSLQRSVLAAEEPSSPHHVLFQQKKMIDGLPVLIGELHSMLPAAVCWLQQLQLLMQRTLKLVYVMSDGGALPLSFSKHVATLTDMEWIHGTVTYGQAFGGEIETLNKYTALLAAKHILQADIVIVSMGPGIAGTNTELGHTGIEVGELVNAVSILGGQPIIIPRISFADVRPRHQGMSHHTLTSLQMIALRSAAIPLPDQLEPAKKKLLVQQMESIHKVGLHQIEWISRPNLDQIRESQARYPIPITTMGRGLREDADFFLGVYSAAEHAWLSLQNVHDT